jgi:hypothetical protein
LGIKEVTQVRATSQDALHYFKIVEAKSDDPADRAHGGGYAEFVAGNAE